MQTAEVNCLKRLCARDFKSSSSHFSQRSCGFQLISVCVCVCLRSRILLRDSGNSISAFFVLIRSVLTGLKQQLQSQLWFLQVNWSSSFWLLQGSDDRHGCYVVARWHKNVWNLAIADITENVEKCSQLRFKDPAFIYSVYTHIRWCLLDRSDCKLPIIICFYPWFICTGHKRRLESC